MTQPIQQIPLSKLVPSEANVRRTGRMLGIGELAASIKAHGLLQNLTVQRTAKGKTVLFEVIAGGRRLAALRELAKAKAIRKDAPIPCHVLNDSIAEEISLAENQHEPMHPADEYEAFTRLHRDHGMSIEDIAARFGVTAAVVRQRLKLGAVSPTLLDLYREGEMNLDQLTAFTITDDHARQEQVWADLGYDQSRRAILRALTEGQVCMDDRRVTFIGLDAYEVAGGLVMRDLFDAKGGYLADVALLNRLVHEKLQTVAETVMAEGWKWVVVEPEFDYQAASAMATIETSPRPLSDGEREELAQLQDRFEALSNEVDRDEPSDDTLAELDRLETAIAALIEEVHAPEDIARAGAFVALGRNGEVRIERGSLRPEDEHSETRANLTEAAAGQATARGGPSAALIAELTAHRTAGLCNDLAQAPELALIAVAHALATQVFYRSETLSCLQISLRRASLSSLVSDIDSGVAGQAIAARHQAWQIRLPEDSAALWHFVASLGTDELLSLLAHCASLSLDAVQRPGARTDAAAFTHAAELANAMPHEMSRYWQPTVANYLGRVSKDQICEAVREGAGEDAARRIAGLKKQAMAADAERLLTGKDWLPPVLRTATATDQEVAA